MKKTWIPVALALVMLLCCTAWAESGVNVDVIRVDGVSVVVLTPETTLLRARGIADENPRADFLLPELLTLIGESAFEGMAAESVEVTENVAAIEARAFADCKSLREITIPATVVRIDDTAFDGCENVTVYGEKGTEAERIAALYGFAFVDTSAEPEQPAPTGSRMPSAPVLPPVPLN